jgi:hypothetical protein
VRLQLWTLQAPHLGSSIHWLIVSQVKSHLQTPVPAVLDWSSDAEATPVGAEYIIMEKLTGVALGDLWHEMEIEDQASIIQQVVNYEKSWMSASFSHFGSLYYSKDLDGHQTGLSYSNEEGVKITEPRFGIGPSVGRDCFDEGRSEISFSRGPCKLSRNAFQNETYLSYLGATVEEYQLSIGEREAACIKTVPRLPKSPMTLPGPYVPTKEKKLATLDIYSKLVKYLLPTNESIITSNIWHEDLHGENILINPQKPSEIIGIIDWQSVVLRPLFENALHPHFLKYKGPRVTDTKPPEYPDTTGLDEAAVEAADQLWNKMSLAAYYRGYVQVHNPTFYRALQFHETLAWALLIYPRSMLVDGEAVYRHRVANELEQEWANLPAVQALGNPPFPIHFSTEEVGEIEKDIEDTARGIDEMRAIKKFMGYLWPEHGMVDESLYEDVKNAFREAKEVALREFATTEDERKVLVEGWPFDD